MTTTIELIASENHVSPAVMHAMDNWMTNKYAEGYPGARYYGGCKHHDEVENLARDRAKQLFGVLVGHPVAHGVHDRRAHVVFGGDELERRRLALGFVSENARDLRILAPKDLEKRRRSGDRAQLPAAFGSRDVPQRLRPHR